MKNNEAETLRGRLLEAEETLRAIRSGEVDALVVLGAKGEQIYTLKGADEPYRVMVESMTEGAVTFSADGTILYCNKRFSEFLQLPLELVIGATILDFVPAGERNGFESLIAACRKGVAYREITLQTRNGSRVPVQFSCRTLKIDTTEAMVAVLTDLSEIERLKDLDRLKSMFIASMSHELRTPLHSIIGFTGFILQGIAGEINAEQRKQLGIVKRNANHLLELINDIIDISKIESGNVELSIAQVDLAELALDIVSSFSGAARDKGLDLTVDGPEKLVIESDRRRLRQAIFNLVGNAVKFTDHGSVRIALSSLAGGASVSVRDTGIGIHAEDISKLFLPFSQLSVEGRASEGSGLGLYLSRKIAQFLGGGITVESKPGVGSIFTISLPQFPPQEAT